MHHPTPFRAVASLRSASSWHASPRILTLRCGYLRCAGHCASRSAGTKGQVHGAAYGPGVYLSPHAQTSIGYAKIISGATAGYSRGSGGRAGGAAGGQSGAAEQAPRFIDPQNLRVMALCEVVKSSHLKKHNTNIWTHTNHDEVVTRMLFVYVSTHTAQHSTAQHSTALTRVRSAQCWQVLARTCFVPACNATCGRC